MMIPPKFKGKKVCSIFHSVPQCAIFSNQSVLFATKLCFVFLRMAIEHTCVTRHNLPDTGVTIITPTDKLSTALPWKLTAISGNIHKHF